MPIPKKLVAPENAIARIDGATGAAAPSTPWHFSINVGFGGRFWSSSSTWYLGALWDIHRRLRDPEAATRARARPNIRSLLGSSRKRFSIGFREPSRRVPMLCGPSNTGVKGNGAKGMGRSFTAAVNGHGPT